MEVAELRDRAGDAAKFLKSMSNASRLLILCHLADGEKSVGELQAHLDLSQSALSQHLAVLRQDEIVSTRRSSQTIFYSLANAPAQEIMATLYEYFCGGGPKKIR